MFLDWWLWGRVVLSLFTKDLCCISSVSSTRTPRPLIPPFCSQPFPFLPCPLWPSLYIAKAPFPLPLLAPTLLASLWPSWNYFLLSACTENLSVVRRKSLTWANGSGSWSCSDSKLHWSQSLNPPWHPSLSVFITVFFPIFCNSNFQFFCV